MPPDHPDPHAGASATTEEALLAVVREKAGYWGCAGEVAWAANEALRRLGGPLPT